MMMSCRLRTRSRRAILTAMPLVAGIRLCSTATTLTSSMKDIGTPLMPITTMSIEPPGRSRRGASR